MVEGSQSHVISALVKKKAEFLGQIDHHKKEVKKIAKSITHIDAAIKVFAPEYDIESVKGKQYREKNQTFEHGELSRLIFDVLRESKKALTILEITEAIKEIKGIQENIRGNVTSSLHLQKKNGHLKKESKNNQLVWSLI